jgi:hypothetical protein
VQNGRLPRFVNTSFELALVFCAVEVASRLSDEPSGTDTPLLETADVHAFSRPSRAGVGASQRPPVDEPVTLFGKTVHE